MLMFCGNMYVANNSSILQYILPRHVDRRSQSRLLPHNRASLISVREFVGGGGGGGSLTARRKRKCNSVRVACVW